MSTFKSIHHLSTGNKNEIQQLSNLRPSVLPSKLFIYNHGFYSRNKGDNIHAKH